MVVDKIDPRNTLYGECKKLNIFKKLYYKIKYKDVSFCEKNGYEGVFVNERFWSKKK